LLRGLSFDDRKAIPDRRPLSCDVGKGSKGVLLLRQVRDLIICGVQFVLGLFDCFPDKCFALLHRCHVVHKCRPVRLQTRQFRNGMCPARLNFRYP